MTTRNKRMKARLARRGIGRMALHMGCLFRRPQSARFFMAGIVRELSQLWN